MKNITINSVKKLIKNQFPQWVHLNIKPVEPGGWDNKTFRLGDEMLIRMPSSEKYAFKVKKEQTWLPKLAPYLPLPIPTPLAMGKPSKEYPCNWSIYNWIPGKVASLESVSNLSDFARDLAKFLVVLHKVDTTSGPQPGEHNFYRGGSLCVYNKEVQWAIQKLGNSIDTKAATIMWEQALASEWQADPVWVHGDIAVGNLLVKKGKLHAVIDFGGLAVGDPACDLVIAWTFFDTKSRSIFKEIVALDEQTWNRARGWALWKALIVCAKMPGTDHREIEKAKRIVETLLIN